MTIVQDDWRTMRCGLQYYSGSRNGRWVSLVDMSYRYMTVEVVKNTRAARPIPMSDTYMSISRTRHNLKRYMTHDACNGRGCYWKTGPVFYHSGDWATLPTESSDARSLDNLNRAFNSFSQISGGVVLGELKGTSLMVAKRIKTLASIVGALRARDPKLLSDVIGLDLPEGTARKIKHHRSDLNDNFLEVKFGWLPVLDDAYRAVEIYREGLRTRGQVLSSTKGHRRRDAADLIEHIDYESTLGGESDVDFGLKHPMADRAWAKVQVKNANVASLQQLGLLNPLSVAWELIPMSFLVDAVVPIGPALEAMTASAGLTVLSCGRVYEERQLSVSQLADGRVVPRTLTQNVYRVSHSGPPGLTMTTFLPQIRNYTGLVINAASILTQRIKR